MFTSKRTLALAVLLSIALRCLSQAAPPAPHVDVPTIAPRPEDVSTLDGIMKAFYEVISGPAGQPRQPRTDFRKDRNSGTSEHV